jgi:2-deoxy-D-gluconate 3-dehydrogenase
VNGLWYNLEGKVALVTGGSRGTGLAIARELLRQKARVVICARKPEGLEVARQELAELAAVVAASAPLAAAPQAPTAAPDLLALPAHIAEEDQVERLFAAVLDRFGRLDILINNVGMNLLTPSTVDADVVAWRKIIDTNLTGPYLCARQAARAMRPRQAGKIVNLSSIAGRRATPGMGIYGVAKAGLEMLTRVLAVELAPDNIQVNAVAPSMVKTGFSAPFWSNESLQARIVAGIPAGRLAETSDVVHPVLFLASDAAGYITGQTLVVDGGGTS